MLAGCAASSVTEGDLLGTWRGEGVELVLAEDGTFESTGLEFVPPASAAPGDPDLVVGNWLLDDRAGPDSAGASVILTVDSPRGTGIIPLEVVVEGVAPDLALVLPADDPAVGEVRLER